MCTPSMMSIYSGRVRGVKISVRRSWRKWKSCERFRNVPLPCVANLELLPSIEQAIIRTLTERERPTRAIQRQDQRFSLKSRKNRAETHIKDEQSTTRITLLRAHPRTHPVRVDIRSLTHPKDVLPVRQNLPKVVPPRRD